ncbi:permease prefix domain 1-containing protein [Deinococcus multiflagellatus]|nr:permease prefix domain 1-containing protein [Deinococcus multiflagellatus]MBZ9712818.1 permease prefix domain 1-containing protein [Deinococcus multiflagellatus]
MTAPAHTCAPALDAYLRRATWGLPEQRRQELWDELEEHVLTRTDHLLLSGLSPQDALTQALRELGPPSRVTLGMAKVYSMPKLFLAATTAALGLSATLYALAGGREMTFTLPVLTQQPVKPSCVRGTVPTSTGLTIVSQQGGVTCYTFNDANAYKGVFLSGTDLQQAINAQGGKATLQGARLSIDLPGLTTDGGDLNALFTKDGTPYYAAATVVGTLRTPLPMTLKDFKAPQVQIGNLKLQLGQPGTNVGRAFYNPLALHLVSRLLSQDDATPLRTVSGGWFAAAPGETPQGPAHVVQTDLPKGEVVMLVTKRAGNAFMADTAEVQAGGSVRLQSEAKNIRFVNDPAQLGPYASGGQINALLVQISNTPLNELPSAIFLPKQATSSAR